MNILKEDYQKLQNELEELMSEQSQVDEELYEVRRKINNLRVEIRDLSLTVSALKAKKPSSHIKLDSVISKGNHIFAAVLTIATIVTLVKKFPLVFSFILNSGIAFLISSCAIYFPSYYLIKYVTGQIHKVISRRRSRREKAYADNYQEKVDRLKSLQEKEQVLSCRYKDLSEKEIKLCVQANDKAGEMACYRKDVFDLLLESPDDVAEAVRPCFKSRKKQRTKINP